MTISAIVITVVDLVFVGLFVHAARDYWRRRDSVRLAVLGVFGCLALVLVGGLVARVVPAARPLMNVVTSEALLGQPIAALWLVGHFWAPARRLITVGLVLFATISMFVAYSAIFGTATLAPIMGGLIVVFAVYFGVFELAPTVGLAMEARRRAGTSRVRMLIGAFATMLVGVALVTMIVQGAIASAARSTGGEASPISIVIEMLALGAALAFLVAFAPPRALRRIGQQTIAYDFMRDLNAIPDGAGSATIWKLLAETAIRASGATRAIVYVGRDEVARAVSPTSSGLTLRLDVDLPTVDTSAPARLELAFRGSPLFVEDDQALLRLLAERTWRSVERDEAIREREQLISDLRAAGASTKRSTPRPRAAVRQPAGSQPA